MERRRFAIPAREQRNDISSIDPLRKSIRAHVDEVARSLKTDVRTNEEIDVLRDKETKRFYRETTSEDVLLNRPILKGGGNK